MSSIIKKSELGFHWETLDPFLFCAHHLDHYPKGSANLGPSWSLEGRNLGHDFDLSNDWKMYHGHTVPGFPEHPHRGFETITIVLEGFVDHSDSAGQTGRYGQGDVQWMTAGSGMQHSEMFPLLNSDKPNTLHLFQIWLNLPQKSKFVPPSYKMLWYEDIPIIKLDTDSESTSSLRLIAGTYNEICALAPTPDSWAAQESNNLDIYLVELDKGDSIEIVSKSISQNRAVYLYEGDELQIDDDLLPGNHQAYLNHKAKTFKATRSKTCFLLMQSEPINEPVTKYGPFVMNSEDEIKQAYRDYQETRFGGWPWPMSDPVHGGKKIRFANYINGKREEREI
jgi:redox-sensitive bicupin YhaK (pirin superfamily)